MEPTDAQGDTGLSSGPGARLDGHPFFAVASEPGWGVQAGGPQSPHHKARGEEAQPRVAVMQDVPLGRTFP